MKVTRVVGVDPGKLTGLVFAEVSGREVVKVTDWRELGPQETCAWLDLVLATSADQVVIEKWLPRGGARTFQPYSLELIGWARGLCWKYGVPLAEQSPEMKERFHAEALKSFPAVGRGGGGHARDALAHVIGWAQTRNLTE